MLRMPTSLSDVVKGLRAQPTSEGRNRFASEAVAACRVEMAATDGEVKTQALDKLAHLRMLGFDEHNQGDEETCFRVIEAMALPAFRHKRAANLAAARLLSPDSEVLLLLTNSLKKELHHAEPYVVGLALGSLACFASKELARQLLPDVCETLQAARPYVRKRGTLALYRMCLRDPEGLLTAYDPLRSKLEDPDPGVVSCAVNAVCELSRTTQAHNILPLTPTLFRLLTTSGNNWMLIKIVKLYCALLTEEPRLARKLLDPLAHIIRTTSAKSLLYECIATATKAINSVKRDATVDQLVALCAVKLREFVQDRDQNLKYLGLVGFCDLTKTVPTVAAEHRDLILLCLTDDDITVRLRALDLLAGMTTAKSVTGIVDKLLDHLRDAPPGKFRDAVVRAIVNACVNDTDDETRFAKVPNIQWFVAVLFDLAGIPGGHGDLLATHLVDVALRVPAAQAFCGKMAAEFLVTALEEDAAPFSWSSEFVGACTFVACEFLTGEGELKDLAPRLVRGMLVVPRSNAECFAYRLDSATQVVVLHNLTKLALQHREACHADVLRALKEHWTVMDSSQQHTELVRERAHFFEALLTREVGLMRNDSPMVPVDRTAQARVPQPGNLDLSVSFLVDTPGSGYATVVDQAVQASRRPLSFRGRHQVVPQVASPPASGSRPSKLTPHMAGGGHARGLGEGASPFYLGPLPSQPQQQHQQQPEPSPPPSTIKFKHSSFLDTPSPVVVVKPLLPPSSSASGPHTPHTAPGGSTREITLKDIDVLNRSTALSSSSSPAPVLPPSSSITATPPPHPAGESIMTKDKKAAKSEKKKKHSKKAAPAAAAAAATGAPPPSAEGDLIDFE